MVSGDVAIHLLSTSTPSMRKMDVAPVSAMARSLAMSMAAIISGDRAFCSLRVEQFEATTVASSVKLHMACRVGSEEELKAETKCLNLFAISFSAPHRQGYVGSTFLCIPFWHGLYPAVMYCWAFARMKAS
jgi:hypothetical protein